VHLLFFGLVARLSDATGISYGSLLGVVVQPAFALGTMLVTRTVVREQKRPSEGYELAVGMSALVLGLSWTAFAFAQPSDGAIVLLWLIAAVFARRDRPIVSGLLLGLSISLKLWAVLGVPILLLLPTFSGVVLGGGTAAAVALVCYGPFYLFGEVRTFEFHWLISPGSPWRALYGTSAKVTWVARLVQGVLVVAAGSAFALFFKKRASVVYLLPVVLTGARVFLDPEFWPWYLLAVWTATLVAAAAVAARSGRSWIALGAVVAALAVVLAPDTQWVGAAAMALALIAALAEPS
jgi:hypothetical protein